MVVGVKERYDGKPMRVNIEESTKEHCDAVMHGDCINDIMIVILYSFA